MKLDGFSQAIAHLNPPPLSPSLATPVGFAVAHSRGQFQRFRHVEIMERAILETIESGGRLIISASVRHGKSELVSKWLPAWFIGTNPDKRVILAGHEADFAARWGRAARDILTEHGHEFGVAVSKRSTSMSRWDIAGRLGGMLTVGVGGSPIGWGADLMIIDDPIKSYADAMSPLVRQRVIEWWSGTMASRVEPGGAVILVMARWHMDDLAGHLAAEQPGQWQELRLPALCDDPDEDALGREMDEPLWPERWSRKALEERHDEVSMAFGEAVWLAQYMGSPAPPGGGMFPEDGWQIIRHSELPAGLRWVRAWDLAASKGKGDYTVGCRMARLDDGRFVIDDVIRKQWAAADVREGIMRTAKLDPLGTQIELPQDPGQAGKDQAQQLAIALAGYRVRSGPVTGSKELRATGYAAQVQHNNVLLVEGSWNKDWIDEHTYFPQGVHDDCVDAGATAFNVLAGDQGTPRVRWLAG